MTLKKKISLLLMFFGEGLIVICFLFLGKNLSLNILTLNIIVTSIIYFLCVTDIIFPIVDLNESSHKTIGSIGIRWFSTLLYSIAAIGIMIVLNTIIPTAFSIQILTHGVILFLLLIGLYATISSSQKVSDIYIEEKQNRSRLDEIKKETQDVQLKLDKLKNIPSDITARLSILLDDLRFISPSNSKEGQEAELNYLKEIKVLQDCLFDTPLNYDKITENIKNCEQTIKNRKQKYSN